jgi:hypothetical protein
MTRSPVNGILIHDRDKVISAIVDNVQRWIWVYLNKTRFTSIRCRINAR